MASIPSSQAAKSGDPALIPQGEYAGRKPLKIQKSVVVVGSDEHSHLHLKSSSVSRHHALIIHDKEGVYIRDLGSRTKVVVNGQPQRETLLAEEDELHIGKFSFKFADGKTPGVPTDPPVPLRFTVNGKTLLETMNDRTVLIGKGDGCDISLAGETISSRHAVIFTARGRRYVRDLDSRTGTYLQGVKVHQDEIRPGDELRVGTSTITFVKVMEPEKVAQEAEAPVAEAPLAEAPVPLDIPEFLEQEAPVAMEDSTVAIPMEPEPVAEEPVAEEPARKRPETPMMAKAPEAVIEPAEPPAAENELDLGLELSEPEAPAVEPVEQVQEAAPLELEPVAEAPVEEPAPEPQIAAVQEPEVVAKAEEPPADEISLEPVQPVEEAIPLELEPVAEQAVAEPEIPAPSEPEFVAKSEEPEPIADDILLDLGSTATEAPAAEPVAEERAPEPEIVVPRAEEPAEKISLESEAITAEVPAAEPSAESTEFDIDEALGLKHEPEAKIVTPEPAKEPVSEIDLSLDDISLPQETVAAPVAKEPVVELEIAAPEAEHLAEKISLESEREVKSITPEPAAVPEIDLSLDDISLDTTPQETAAVPVEEPVAEAPAETEIPEQVSEAVPAEPAPIELDLSETPVAETPQPVTEVEPVKPLETVVAEESTKAEIPEPIIPPPPIEVVAEVEPAKPLETVLAEEPVKAEITPIEIPALAPVVAEKPVEKVEPAPFEITPEPDVSLLSITDGFEAPADLKVDADVAPVAKAELVETPAIEPVEPAAPEIDLAPAAEAEPEPAQSPIVIEPIETSASVPMEEAPIAPPTEVVEPAAAEAEAITEEVPKTKKRATRGRKAAALAEPEEPKPRKTRGRPKRVPPGVAEPVASAEETAAPVSEVPAEISEATSALSAEPVIEETPIVAEEQKIPEIAPAEELPAMPPVAQSMQPAEIAEIIPPAEATFEPPDLEEPAIEPPAFVATGEVPQPTVEEVVPPAGDWTASTAEAGEVSEPAISQEPIVSPEPVAETPAPAPEPEIQESAMEDIAPSPTELEIPSLASEEVSEPIVAEEPAPETLAPVDETEIHTEPEVSAVLPAADVSVSASATEEIFTPTPTPTVQESQPETPGLSSDLGIHEPVINVTPATTWNITEATEETLPSPELSRTEPQDSEAISSESSADDVLPVGEEAAPGEWNLPEPPEEIAAPIVSADQAPPERALPGTPPPIAPPPAAAMQTPNPSIFQSPLGAFGGFSFIGGGVVNIDHSLGGMPGLIPDDPPMLGGMPIDLPELPPAPAGFGQIRIDTSGKPRPMPRQEPPRVAAAPAPPPIIAEPLPPVAISSAPPEVFETPVEEAPPEPLAPELIAEPEPVAPPESPPAPKVFSQPQPAAPPPIITPPKPAAAAPVAPPPPPRPKMKTPPASFSTKVPRRGTFSNDVYQTGQEDPNTTRSHPTHSAFDGLAMGTGNADVFSAAGATPINDAPFGGTSTVRSDDFVIPESPEHAQRAAAQPPEDFSDDDFWNRTDEDDGHAPPPATLTANQNSGGHIVKDISLDDSMAGDAVPDVNDLENEGNAAVPAAGDQSEAEPIKAQPLDVQPPEAQQLDAQLPDTQQPDVQPLDSQKVDSPESDFELLESQSIDSNPTDSNPIDSNSGIPAADDSMMPPLDSEVESTVESTAEIPGPGDSIMLPVDSGVDERPLRPELPPDPMSREEIDELSLEPLDAPVSAAVAPSPPPEITRPKKRRRFRIPFLMPLILIAAAVGLWGVWKYTVITSQINGTLTFLNFIYTPQTQDSIDFEAGQRRLLDDKTRQHAAEILMSNHHGIDAGFLKTADQFDKVASTISLSSSSTTTSPQTLLQFTYNSIDKEGDRDRMQALLQAMWDRNASQLDANRRLQGQQDQAERAVNEAQQKMDKIKNEITALQSDIDGAPPPDQFSMLLKQKNDLESAKRDAEDAVTRDQAELGRVQAMIAAVSAATTQPVVDDPQLKQMKQQLADLSAEVDSARSDQLAGATLARQKLEAAAKQFDDQISAANALLGNGSQLRQFVDSAMESQTKARNLINLLIVDGEDLEQQLEDTKRSVEDLIQTQQADKWALDPQLQSLRENLESAQHRYNANSGQGVTDPRILDPLQKEIDDWTAKVKQRQAQLGPDPGEMRVQESLNNIITALRKKLAKEKSQTDQVLDPLEKQLANLDPVVAALPATQQDLARELHDRLNNLNDARAKYAETVGDDSIAPSAKVTELRNKIADLKTNIAARQADLQRNAAAARDAAQNDTLSKIQAKLKADQKVLDEANKALETGLTAYDDAHAKQVAANAAQQKKMSLQDDQHAAFTELEAVKKDRDEKQSAAEHAFDLKPVTAGDVTIVPSPDPRNTYYLAILGGALVAMVLAAFVSHGSQRKNEKKQGKMADLDSLVIPMASDDDHPATA